MILPQSTSQYTLQGLEADTDYQVDLYIYPANNISYGLTTVSFLTQPEPLTEVAIYILTSTSVTYSWLDIPGALSYYYELYDLE